MEVPYNTITIRPAWQTPLPRRLPLWLQCERRLPSSVRISSGLADSLAVGQLVAFHGFSQRVLFAA